MTWSRLGQECDLRQKDWVHQFNAFMNHQKFFGKYLREIIEIELCNGDQEWSLDKRKQFVENKLMIAHKAQETLVETIPRDRSQEVC